ncbi:MAG: hypothetical protein K2W95_09385 [Candidatus Obscuribacterales bacterium]|nr:hypothetical protein [Candidatus Obscuribacterales bacterium]
MKRFIAVASLAIMAILSLSSPVSAQRGWDNRYDNQFSGRYGGGINNTQAQLQARITAGINSGRLSSREASRLQAKLARINQVEMRLRATGNRLSFGERQRLNRQLANLSSEITRDMNDFDRRFASGRRGGWR